MEAAQGSVLGPDGTFRSDGLREDARLVVGEDLLVRDALPRLHTAVQVPLEVLGRVLAAEVDLPSTCLLYAREPGVLTHLPVGIRALGPRVRGPEVDRGPAVVLCRAVG